MKIIAPSILACNFLNLEEEIAKINDSNAKWIHFDVMDGHFVPNISFGPGIFKFFKENSKLFTDVHIMVTNPRFVSDLFIAEGANQIVFHYEVCQDKQEVLELIDYLKKRGIKAGISIKPNTSPKVLEPFLALLDLVLVMSVEPGFGGQKFMPIALEKLKYLKEMKQKYDYKYVIQVDGGIDHTNYESCYNAGAECLVAGSYLFKQKDFSKAVDSLL